MIVNGKDYPIYYGKYKMFQTTNQNMIQHLYYHAFGKDENPTMTGPPV